MYWDAFWPSVWEQRLASQSSSKNVPGADGTIGVGRVARARPDGYTIEFGTVGTNVLTGAYYSLSYDLLGDLAPISAVAAVPSVLYAKAFLPAKDLKELIVWLRANPNKASAGVATVGYRMLMALFQKETETRFTPCPVSRRCPGIAGPDRGPDRFFL